MDEDDDIPQLSASTLAALQEFYNEQNELQTKTINLDNQSTEEDPQNAQIFQNDLNDLFPEDWNMSQFWYNEDTCKKLAEEVQRLASSDDGKILCISCPSVFHACGPNKNIHLFEYDKRFGRFGSFFHFYDYNEPEAVPPACISAYSIIIADPPFLANECLEKLAKTIKLVSKPEAKIILCTGAIMEKAVEKYLPLKRTEFIPIHKKNLGNEFACFANYKLNIL